MYRPDEQTPGNEEEADCKVGHEGRPDIPVVEQEAVPLVCSTLGLDIGNHSGDTDRSVEDICCHVTAPVSDSEKVQLEDDTDEEDLFRPLFRSVTYEDDEEDDDEDVTSSSAGPSTPPRSPGHQPSVSSFFIDGEEDVEPAPAYEYEDSQDSASTWGPASTARLSTSTVGHVIKSGIVQDDST